MSERVPKGTTARLVSIANLVLGVIFICVVVVVFVLRICGGAVIASLFCVKFL